MKIIYAILCLLISAVSFAQKIKIEDINLKWKDFTVKEGIRNHPYAAKILNHNGYTSKFEKKGETIHLIIETELTVDHDKSWVKKEWLDKSLPEEKQALLNHEKGHLIIALIQFKKLQETLSTFHFSKRPKMEIDSIFKASAKICDAANTQYDDETNHSANVDKQKEWMERLLSEMNTRYANDEKIKYSFKQDIILD